MAELATSVAAGVIRSLLEKLGSLAAAEYALFTSDRRQVELLVDGLSSMKAVLEELAYIENLDPLTKRWRDQVRELTYDTEDCLVPVLQEREDGAQDWSSWKIFPFFKDLREGYILSKQINQIKADVIELSARQERLKVDEFISTSSRVSIDPRLHVLYKDTAGLVGVDGQKDKLMEMLKDDDQHLKVVSVVGFGGLGKTTLANLVYHALPTLQHHEHRFDCQAFVSVSQRPDINGVLCSLLRMLGGSITPSDNINVQVISIINKHLQHKRMEGDHGGSAVDLHAGVVGILAGAGGHRSDDAAGSFDLDLPRYPRDGRRQSGAVPERRRLRGPAQWLLGAARSPGDGGCACAVLSGRLGGRVMEAALADVLSNRHPTTASGGAAACAAQRKVSFVRHKNFILFDVDAGKGTSYQPADRWRPSDGRLYRLTMV